MTHPAKLTAYCDPHDNSLVIERVTDSVKQRIKTAVVLESSLLGKVFPCWHGPTNHSYRVRLLGTFQIVVDTRAAEIVTTTIGAAK
jgi:hypothetical protein